MKRILVVDDEPHILRLIKARLEANNYEVIIAEDGEECLKKLAVEKPDLLILDIMMPKMDGYDVLIATKETDEMNESKRKIPVIVLTARADNRIRDLIEQGIITAYLTKPFKSEELLEKIKRLLENE